MTDRAVEALCGDLSAIRAPRGSSLNALSWQTEAPLRMLLNNLDPEVAEHPEQLIVYGLPDRYYEDYVKNVQAVTADAVQKAAATYIQPQKFLVVVVGDRKVIEPGIRSLNLAPVRTISVQEALGE